MPFSGDAGKGDALFIDLMRCDTPGLSTSDSTPCAPTEAIDELMSKGVALTLATSENYLEYEDYDAPIKTQFVRQTNF